MINSSIIKQELLRGNRNYQVAATIVVKDGDGNSVTLNIDNTKIMLGGLEIDDAVSEDEELTAIGSTIINSAQLVINNSTEEFSEYDFDKATCVIYVGLNYINGTTQDTEYIKKFTGFVDTAIYNGIYITLTVYDNMAKLNVPYTSSVSFPTIDTAVLIQLCNACGVAIKTSSLPLPGTSYNLEEKPSGESATCLDVVGWIAAIHGCFARCDVNGELEFKWFDQNLLPGIASGTDGGSFDSGTPYSTGDDVDGGTFNPWNTGDVLDGGSFEDLAALHVISGLSSQSISTDDVIITGIKVIVANDSATDASTEYTSGTTGYMIEVSNNPFITTSNGQAIATALGNQLIGLTYRKANITHLSDPTIEAGDVALIRDRKARVYPILVTRTHFSVSSYQQTVSGAETPVKNTSVQYSQNSRNYVELKKSVKASINDLNDRLIAAGGLYESTETPIGGGTIYYLHNKPTRAASDIQIAFSDVGIVLTANGTDADPTWYGLQANGIMLASILQAHGINADWIRSGAIQVVDTATPPNVLFQVDITNKKMVLADNGETYGNSTFKIIRTANSEDRYAELFSDALKLHDGYFALGELDTQIYPGSYMFAYRSNGGDQPSNYDWTAYYCQFTSGTFKIIKAWESNQALEPRYFTIFEVNPASGSVEINGTAFQSTPIFTPSNGVTVSNETWSKVGNIVTGDLTITGVSVGTTTATLGQLDVHPGHSVIGNARTSSVVARCSIDSSGYIKINSGTSIASTATIYLTFSFVAS